MTSFHYSHFEGYNEFPQLLEVEKVIFSPLIQSKQTSKDRCQSTQNTTKSW